MMKQVEILDLPGTCYVYTRSGTVVCLSSDRNVVSIKICDGQILGDHSVDLVLKLNYVEIRLLFGKGYDKAVLYVIVSASRKLLLGHTELAKILSGVRHKSVRQRIVYGILDFGRLGAEYRRPAYKYLLTCADKKVGFKGKQGINEVKMLNKNSFSLF